MALRAGMKVTEPLVPALLIVALSVAVVIGLTVDGIVPAVAPGTTSGSVEVTTFYQAVSLSARFADHVPGGPWLLVDAGGFAWTYPVNVTGGGFGTTGSCAPVGGNVPLNQVPAYSGDYSSGAATFWDLSYVSPSNASGVLDIAVMDGAASEVGVVPDAHGCTAIYNYLRQFGLIYANLQYYLDPDSGDIIDSSSAVQAMIATPTGTDFEADLPTGNLSAELVVGSQGPIWALQIDAGACSSGTGRWSTLLGDVFATNGTIAVAPSVFVHCPF